MEAWQGMTGQQIFFSNVDSVESRDNICVRISRDEDETWEEAKEILSGKGGYSDINVRKNKMTCLLGEYINEQERYEISFYLFNMKWLATRRIHLQ